MSREHRPFSRKKGRKTHNCPSKDYREDESCELWAWFWQELRSRWRLWGWAQSKLEQREVIGMQWKGRATLTRQWKIVIWLHFWRLMVGRFLNDGSWILTCQQCWMILFHIIKVSTVKLLIFSSQILSKGNRKQRRSVKGGSGSKTKYKDRLGSVLQIQP